MPIWLIGFALRASGWARAVLRWLLGNPIRVLAALCILLVLIVRYEAGRADKAEKAILNLARAAKAAQAAATAAQIAANHQPAAISAAIAEKSDAQAPAYYRGAAAAADLHRLRGACPGGPGGAGLPGADHAPAIDDRPAVPADMVSRPRADDDLLVAAAARAAQMHADAEALIKAGVAVASTSQAQPKPQTSPEN